MADVSTSVKAGHPTRPWLAAGGGVDVKETKLYRAVKPWTPRYTDPLALKKGDYVRIVRDPTIR